MPVKVNCSRIAVAPAAFAEKNSANTPKKSSLDESFVGCSLLVFLLVFLVVFFPLQVATALFPPAKEGYGSYPQLLP